MAENTSSGGNGLYFIVGGLVVIVGLGAYAYTGGHFGGRHAGGGGTTTTTEQTTTTPTHHGESTTTTTTTEKKTP